MKSNIITRLFRNKKGLIGNICECLYVNKLGNLAEMDKFLENANDSKRNR